MWPYCCGIFLQTGDLKERMGFACFFMRALRGGNFVGYNNTGQRQHDSVLILHHDSMSYSHHRYIMCQRYSCFFVKWLVSGIMYD